MPAKVTFDMTNAERNFSRVMDELAKLPGFDRRTVVMAEAGSILKKCAALTKVAPLDKIDRGAKLRALKSLKLTGGGDISINAGIRGDYGRVFIRKLPNSRSPGNSKYRRTHDAPFRALNQHYKDAQWENLSNTIDNAQQAIGKATKDAKASAGLARQSWIQIAASLGIDLTRVPGAGLSAKDIRAALASRARGDKLYENGIAREEKKNESYFVTLINRLPYGRRIGLDKTLRAAIAGRVSYITVNMAKGAFDSIESVIKKFPRWKLTR